MELIKLRCYLHTLDGRLDEGGYGSRLRYVDRVTALLLDDCRTGALGHGRWAAGGIILSSVATMYQLGLFSTPAR